MQLEEILLTDPVEDSIIENMDIVLSLIPELKPCINFKQRHPHHHLDVWMHTLLALSMSPNDYVIRLALLLHDIGKPHSYQIDGDVYHYDGHAEKSAEMASEILKRFNYSKDFRDEVIYLIKMHDTEILMEDIINDYELSYKRFIIQKCDALAHHPDKLEKRKAYLEKTKQLFKNKKRDI